MNESAKVIPVAAAISIFFSLGTVTVYNSFGSVDAELNDIAEVRANVAPEVLALPEAVESLRRDVEAAQATIRSMKSALESAPMSGSFDDVIARLDALEKDGAGEASGEIDPETMLAESEDLFAALGKAGFTAFGSSKVGKLADMLRALGDPGLDLLVEQFSSEEVGRRFFAAALAERLKDPSLIDPLAQAALEDENFMVRRMSSHALAFMNHEDAGDPLLRIVQEETRDAGSRLNAWYGLASLGRPETIPTFHKILEVTGGDVSADLVVDTATKVTDPDQNLFPILRSSYDNESVSKPMKTRILGILGRSNERAYDDFLREVSETESNDADLRRAARSALSAR